MVRMDNTLASIYSRYIEQTCMTHPTTYYYYYCYYYDWYYS